MCMQALKQVHDGKHPGVEVRKPRRPGAVRRRRRLSGGRVSRWIKAGRRSPGCSFEGREVTALSIQWLSVSGVLVVTIRSRAEIMTVDSKNYFGTEIKGDCKMQKRGRNQSVLIILKDSRGDDSGCQVR